MNRSVLLLLVFLVVSAVVVASSASFEVEEPKNGDSSKSKPSAAAAADVPDDPEADSGAGAGSASKIPLENDSKDSSSFAHGFVATLSVIILSELGDKTFFIAAIMAMRHSRLTVFVGAMSALGVMHVMSAFFGYSITVIPRIYTHYISSFLFAVFGLKMLKEGWRMSANEAQEEFDEVQEDLRKREDDVELGGGKPGTASDPAKAKSVLLFVSKIFIQAFTMTFLAEWGDRSQLATIVLAAREDVSAVVIAGLIGHALCTGLAVVGGRIIAQRISIRTVTLIGGFVFIVFAFSAIIFDPME